MTGVRLARAAVVGGMVLAGFTLAGCGSSDGEAGATETETTTVTEGDAGARAEFIADGDALCAEGQAEAADLARRAQEIQSRGGTAPDEELFEQAADIWDDQVRLIERFRDRLGDLEPPPGDEARVEEFLGALDDGLEIARDVQSDLADGNEPSSERLQSYAETVQRGNTLARAYGFEVCGQIG